MEVVQNILHGLFPSRCILCQRTVTGCAVMGHVEICADCFNMLPRNDFCCVHCALPLADEVADTVLCGRCINKTPAFDYAYSLFRYEEDIIRLVHQLKFAEKVTYARSLGEMLLQFLQAKLLSADEQPYCLLPVPLHPARLRQRGYNQSIEIARAISKRLQIPIEYDAVTRQRKTFSQTGLDARQRQKNVSGAFQIVSEIRASHMLIIDDVMTTGATVNELAAVLKKSKVERVGVLSIARAPLKN